MERLWANDVRCELDNGSQPKHSSGWQWNGIASLICGKIREAIAKHLCAKVGHKRQPNCGQPMYVSILKLALQP